MKYIKTGQTRSDAKRRVLVMVDDEDYAYLNQFNWQVGKDNTVKTHKNKLLEERLIHRVIMKPSKNQEIDHIDGNRLNNQKSNLRYATSSQNKANRGPRKDNKSGYKGVSWHKQRKKWTARIKNGSKYEHLGLFQNKIDAAKTYNIKAIEYYGSYAWLNIIK